MYLHDHGGVLHDPPAWPELLDGAGGVQRAGAPGKQKKNNLNIHLQILRETASSRTALLTGTGEAGGWLPPSELRAPWSSIWPGGREPQAP